MLRKDLAPQGYCSVPSVHLLIPTVLWTVLRFAAATAINLHGRRFGSGLRPPSAGKGGPGVISCECGTVGQAQSLPTPCYLWTSTMGAFCHTFRGTTRWLAGTFLSFRLSRGTVAKARGAIEASRQRTVRV